MHVVRRWLCLFLVFLLVFPAMAGMADDQDRETLEYLYSFIPGTVLEGEGTGMIRELLEAMAEELPEWSAAADSPIPVGATVKVVSHNNLTMKVEVVR